MRRRDFIKGIGGSAIAWPLGARAQQVGQRLIGALIGPAQSEPGAQSWFAAFQDALAKLGWRKDSNLRIELRWGAGDADRIGSLAKELVDMRPDAIFGVTTPVIGALARETRTIPIVFAILADPIGGGFAASIAHPGGNITGFAALDSELGGKWVGLLKEIAPRTVRMALLFNPVTSSPLQFYLPTIQAAASSLGIDITAAPVRAKGEIEGAVSGQARTSDAGLIVMPDVFNARNSDLIISLAARYRVPAIYFNAPYFTRSGGLISYGDDYVEECRLAAGYIDRILKGAKPEELPIQQPTKFELVINLKTAKVLGLSPSSGLLSIADDVIE
jgi:putative tryptophan/tyrosine transport system substrate-binding protein